METGEKHCWQDGCSPVYPNLAFAFFHFQTRLLDGLMVPLKGGDEEISRVPHAVSALWISSEV
jgi:hypothetical protein